MPLASRRPTIAHDVFIAANASVIGDVNVGEGSALWYGTVVRGDVNSIKIGKKTSVGNRTVVHVSGTMSSPAATHIGDNVVIGDGAILHGCTLHDECRVEDGAIVYDGAVVEKHAIVGPGAVVTSGKRVPSGQYWAGNPAKFVRDVSADEVKALQGEAGQRYAQAKLHEKAMLRSPEQKETDLISEDEYQSMRPGTRVGS